MSELPLSKAELDNLYLLVGALVVLNLGAIGGFILFLFKLVWRAAKYDSRIEKMESDINAAFKKIRGE